MSLIRTPATGRRINPVPAQVYTLPVVRELPAPIVDTVGLGTW